MADEPAPPPDAADARFSAALREQVTQVERDFAATMAHRDFEAFGRFISEDAVFMSGGHPLRGRAAVLAHWAKFFEGPDAPFSWEPDLVEVTASGDLGQSNGPVKGPDGVVFARFYSTWRLEKDGVWRIVFDNGYAVPRKPAQ